jgi:hypothetical protein
MNKIILTLAFLLMLVTGLFSQSAEPQQFQRKSVAYLSFIIPVAVLQGGTITPNFKKATTIGFPVGVNVLYSPKFGFSFEFTPSITVQQPSGKNMSSKMNNLLFDPGPMFRFPHDFTIIPRLAFETSGRYGFTPVFNKVLIKTQAVNYFLAGSLPVRFGNNAAASIGLNIQFGFIFN